MELSGGMLVGLVAASAAGSAYIGWRAGRLVTADTETATGTDPYLLPDPALDWLRRAHNALGVWLAEPAQLTDKGPRFQRALAADPAGLTVEAVERRLTLAIAQANSGAERLEGATLIFGTSSGYAAGLLLSGDATRDRLDAATEDLVRLLEGAARRPLMQRMHRDSGTSRWESVGSVGLRLAYQLERILDAEVMVAVVEKGAVRVVGTSGRADRRLMDTFASPGSPLYRVAKGEEPSLTSIADPLGGLVEDRRARFTPAIVMRIPNDDQAIGAIAFWTSEDAQPIGPVISEVHEALRNAGPRFARALENEVHDEMAMIDPLTGLHNRRGLEGAMSRHGIQHGALIYADLDKFKLLNDTHGHPAGDAALIHFARLLHAQIRTSDTAARIGGEEFALWLPGASLRVGERVAESLRVKLGTTRWEWQNASWPLSASFGVAACPESSRSQLNLPAQADAAMYRAKNAGRNRVSVAERLEQAS
jgi:diguanylate cyclase (GGDEF)-like protein